MFFLRDDKGSPRSDGTVLFLQKVWGPFLILFGTAAICRGNLRPLVLFWPAVLWAIVALTFAQVVAEPGQLRYRRFLRWHSIPYSSVIRCGPSWICRGGFFDPVSPRARLRRVHFIAATYFGPDPLTAFISARASGEPPQARTRAAPRSPRARLRRCALALMGGVAYSFLVSLLFPGLADFRARLAQAHANGPARWFMALQRGEALMLTWPYLAFLAVGLALFIALSRCGRGAALASFLLGAALSWPVMAAPAPGVTRPRAASVQRVSRSRRRGGQAPPRGVPGL